MPPKVTKKYLWLTCERCGCTITSNDKSVHAELSCSKDQLRCPYIDRGKLFSFLEYADVASCGVPRDAVLIHPSAANLLGTCIGAPLKLSKDGSPSLVRHLWPSKSSSPAAIILTSNNLESSWCAGKDRAVTVSPLTETPVEAFEIAIKLITDFTPDTDITGLLKQYYLNNIVHCKNILSYCYFGKKLEFQITDLKTNSTLEGDQKWFTLTDITKWTIMKSQKTIHKKEIRLGGMESIKKEITDLINTVFNKETPDGFQPTRGIVLYGHSGTGKTSLCKLIIDSLSCFSVELSGPGIFSKYFGETENAMKNIFFDAIREAPSVIFIDEIDTICPKRISSSTEQEIRVTSAFVSLLDSLHESNHKVFVLATTRKIDMVDNVLRRFGRLDKEIECPVPDRQSRRHILHCLLEKTTNNLTSDDINTISDLAHGYVGADIVNLCTQASMHCMSLATDLNKEALTWALTVVRPSAMRELLIEIPDVRWSDIGGLEELKMTLKQAVEWPLKHADSFKRLGIKPPGGVLMYGPPGCSKTMIAKALATESGLNFLSIKGPELFSKWVGESERAVRDLFRKARQVAPAIVFFDEMDAIGGERGEGEAGVRERVLAQLLTELDGVVPLGAVTILAATNRPDRMDRALLRPGRLDRLVYVPLPDIETRTKILDLKLSRVSTASDVSLQSIVRRTDGFSGAELHAVCHEAALRALHESIDSPEVCMKHFDYVLTEFKPRTPLSLVKIYEDFSKGDH